MNSDDLHNEVERQAGTKHTDQEWQRSVGLAFLIAVMTGLTVLIVALNQWMHDEQQVPIRHIQILGERTYISVPELTTFIRDNHRGSFFATTVDAVHASIVAQPWVYQASVRKKWPDTIQVFVVEQKPVANWNADQLLNSDGQAFTGNIQLDSLPSMFGPTGAEKTALAGLNTIQGLLRPLDLTVTGLLLTERYAWHITLSNGIELDLGRNEFIERMQRFVDVYPLLDANDKTIKYVDLRYDTGVAVGWQEENTGL